MPEKIYHEDEVIVSQEDIYNSSFYVPAIMGNIMRVWKESNLPKNATLPNERIMIEIMEILKEIYREDRTFVEYDTLREGIVKKLRYCIEQLHKTGSLPEECRHCNMCNNP